MRVIKINTTITAYELEELPKEIQDRIIERQAESMFNPDDNLQYKVDSHDYEKAVEMILYNKRFYDKCGNELIITENLINGIEYEQSNS